MSKHFIDHYPDEVTKVVGIDPNLGMYEMARSLVAQKFESGIGQFRTVEVLKGYAESLPVLEASFGSVVSVFTLCSVNDLDASLAEVRRVLVSGGRLFFLAHTMQPNTNLTWKLQQAVQPLWKKIACGCCVDRDTVKQIESHGFEFQMLRSVGYTGFPNFLSPIFMGIAVKK